MPSNDPNVGIAFALVCGAGMSTALGAAVVFSPRLVKYASRRTLAGALGLSAGVMMYVSFVEILQKSTLSFEDAGNSEDDAYMYSTACFFGGVVLMAFLNYLVTALLGGHHHGPSHGGAAKKNTTEPVSNIESVQGEDATVTPTPARGLPCCSEDPVGALHELQHMAEEIDEFETKKHANWEGAAAPPATQHEDDEVGAVQEECQEDHDHALHNQDYDDDDDDNSSIVETPEEHENRKLMRMSINTALAIGIHNFPEGLATFVAALNDPRVGTVLAIAIAIHNIPEGLCVAMPIYYATGNRWKAFGWAVLSGVSEPIAALLGWAVLANSFSDTMYAVLFGVVAGMMVIISARELLPTAHRYDPEDTVVTYSFIVGMGIMALSLVLFLI